MARYQSPSTEAFVIRAQRAAEAAWRAELMTLVQGSAEAEGLQHALFHPTLRHLAELWLNDSCTSAGARILINCGYADCVEISARRQDMLSGGRFTALALTGRGNEVYKNFRSKTRQVWFAAFEAILTSYACRDEGAGISMGPAMLGYALDYGDTELLCRLTSPEDVAYQIGMRNFMPPGLITRQMRLSLAAAWSPRCDNRLGAGIFLQSQYVAGPFWRIEDAADFSGRPAVEVAESGESPADARLKSLIADPQDLKLLRKTDRHRRR